MRNIKKERTVSWECVKEITKALKKNFKGIEAYSYGYCCNSDYGAYHKYKNDDDSMNAKIFKGGLNNQYHVDSITGKGEFEIGSVVYYNWALTNFKPLKVLAVMNEVANKYGCVVLPPITDDGEINECKCFELKALEV